ncbi:M20 aminoacylase family protein [Bosea sp. TAF32]|uniref:M20 aminoacylase family protein n=1 Tax=Bosea sp. TAF32 TaxID=3237482 RepID=UPI003F8F5A32
MNAPVRNPSPVLPEVAEELDRFIALRRHFHQNPELSTQEKETARHIAELLGEWGYDVETGIGGEGVVGTLRVGTGTRALGIRADFDALPIAEATNLPHASRNAGVMHACGHDGHTAILLAAARALARRKRFDGTLRLIYQPAEEISVGARSMIRDGLFERFPVDAIFGLHNWPGVPEGVFGFVDGPAMAAVDKAVIRIVGHGCHGAAPHETVDPVLAAAHVVTALQSLVSRNVPPLEAAVVTVGSIHGGTASNVIPDSVELQATIRSFSPEVRRLLSERLPALVKAQAEAFGATADVEYRLGMPAVVNHAGPSQFARETGLAVFGAAGVEPNLAPRTASEDFAYFLEERPGAFLFVGAGKGPPLHSPQYDFNDALIAPAAPYWTRLAERFLA